MWHTKEKHSALRYKSRVRVRVTLVLHLYNRVESGPRAQYSSEFCKTVKIILKTKTSMKTFLFLILW